MYSSIDIPAYFSKAIVFEAGAEGSKGASLPDIKLDDPVTSSASYFMNCNRLSNPGMSTGDMYFCKKSISPAFALSGMPCVQRFSRNWLFTSEPSGTIGVTVLRIYAPPRARLSITLWAMLLSVTNSASPG